MKYKLLLIGKNEVIIDDIFKSTDTGFDLITSSLRFADILAHVRCFEPDVIVYCLYREDRESITNVGAVKGKSYASRIPIIVIGSNDDVVEFKRQAPNLAGLVLEKPITAGKIKAEIVRYLENLKREEEELKREAEEREAARRAAKEAATAAANGEDGGNAVDSSVAQALAALKAAASVSPGDPSLVKALAALKQAAKDTVPAPPERKTILVVDDDIRMVKVIKRHLEEDYNVASAVSGAVALRYLSKKKVDLVLLDYMMPEKNGPEVLKDIRSNPATASLPVVFLTGASDRDKISQALAQKPQGYLLKPVDKDQLMQTLRKLI